MYFSFILNLNLFRINWSVKFLQVETSPQIISTVSTKGSWFKEETWRAKWSHCDKQNALILWYLTIQHVCFSSSSLWLLDCNRTVLRVWGRSHLESTSFHLCALSYLVKVLCFVVEAPSFSLIFLQSPLSCSLLFSFLHSPFCSLWVCGIQVTSSSVSQSHWIVFKVNFV